MKNVDIRKVFVGTIARQSKVERRIDPSDLPCSVRDYPHWEYDKASENEGLFVRVLGGYKHISTGKVYPKASRLTGNKTVIIPDSVKSFNQKYPEVVSEIVKSQKSSIVSVEVLRTVEEKLFSKNLKNM